MHLALTFPHSPSKASVWSLLCQVSILPKLPMSPSPVCISSLPSAHVVPFLCKEKLVICVNVTFVLDSVNVGVLHVSSFESYRNH